MKEYYAKIYKGTKKTFMQKLEKNIEEGAKLCVVTANPEILMTADRKKNMKRLLMSQEAVIVPDGIGVILGGQRLGYEFAERIPGVEICSGLMTYADQTKRKLFLFGAQPDILKKLVNKIQDEYPGITLCGYENGYVKDKDGVFEKIQCLEPDIVLVALGVPLQELLIYKHMRKMKKGIFIGVGGSFDVLSGQKKRAPEFFVKHNLEWLYRITTEPKRLKRFWDNNVKFLFAVEREKHERFFRKN